MANQVLFKYGLEANLATLRGKPANIQPGAFYVTEDSHRMYLGIQTNPDDINTRNIVSLNQGVIVVDTLANLPNSPSQNEVGHFYYVKDSNILCTYNGTTWTQINPDSDIEDFRITCVDTYLGGGVTEYKFTSTIENNKEETFSFDWTIQADHTLGITLTKNTQTKTVNGKPVSYDTPVMKFSCNVSMSISGPTNTNDNYVDLSLTGTKNSPYDKTRIKGDHGITITDINSSNINRSFSISGETLEQADVNEVENYFKTDGTWHTKLILKDNNQSISTIDAKSFLPKIDYGALDSKTSKRSQSDTKFIPTNDGDSTATLILDTYTTGEVDKRLQANLAQMDAMKYMGVTPASPKIDAASSLFFPEGVQIGHVYKVNVKNKWTNYGHYYLNETLPDSHPADEIFIDIGDLLIANVFESKTEEADGTIALQNLKWDYVPSGDDVNNIYEVDWTNSPDYGFKIVEKTGEVDPSTMLALELVAGQDIELSNGDDDNTSANYRNISIAHTTYTTGYTYEENNKIDLNEGLTSTNADKNEDGTVNVYTQLYFDAVESLSTTNGHLTNITSQGYQFKDTNASVKNVTSAFVNSGTTNKIKHTSGVQLYHMNDPDYTDDQKTTDIYYQSTNNCLSISQSDGNTLQFNLVWETF